MVARLPVVHGDPHTWGDILNEFLRIGHTVDGRHEDAHIVTEYGAVGDGVADDTTALQATINAAGTGGVVSLPPGTYLISATLTLPSAVAILGTGWNSVIKQKDDTNLPALLSWPAGLADTLSYQYCLLADFKVDGNRSNNAAATCVGILADRLQYSVLRNIRVEHVYGDGYRLDGPGGLFWAQTNTVALQDCWAYNCADSGLVAGSGAADVHIVGGDYGFCGDSAITLQSSSGTLVGATLWGTVAGSGLVLGGPSNQVRDCNIEGNTEHGILVNQYGEHSFITGNKIYANNFAPSVSGTYDGIYVGGVPGDEAANIVIVGNFIYPNILPGGTTQRSAIYLDTYHSRCIIDANVVGFAGAQAAWAASAALIRGVGGTDVLGTNPGRTETAPVSVRDFGAVGDGVTDDTAAIQAAIDSMYVETGLGGGRLHLPAGEYLISDTLAITRMSITVSGDGWTNPVTYLPPSAARGTTLVWGPSAGNKPMIKVRDSKNVLFENLRFQGERLSNAANIPTAGINWHWLTGDNKGGNGKLHIDRCFFGPWPWTVSAPDDQTLQVGVLFSGDNGNNDEWTISRCVITDATVAGVQIDNSQTTWGRITDTLIAECPIGISTAGDIGADNCHFNRNVLDWNILSHTSAWISRYNAEYSEQFIKLGTGAQVYVYGGDLNIDGLDPLKPMIDGVPAESSQTLVLREVEFDGGVPASTIRLGAGSTTSLDVGETVSLVVENCTNLDPSVNLDVDLLYTGDKRDIYWNSESTFFRNVLRDTVGLGPSTVRFDVDALQVAGNLTYPQPSVPADHAALAWTFPPRLAGSGTAMSTAGRLELARLRRVPAGTILNIIVHVITAGGTLTAGQCFATLYTAAGVLVGVTADQSTAWGSTGRKVMALTVPYVNAAGDFYVGLWFNGTTGPALARGGAAAGALANGALAAPNLEFCHSSTGLTTTAPDPFGAQTAGATAWWVALE